MFKLFVIAAAVACANGYYNHGPIAHEPYYGNYGHALVPAPLPGLDVHHGNIYNHGYGHLAGVPSQTKIVPATYPGAVHKSVSHAVANSPGYVGPSYTGHGSPNHGVASYVHPHPAIVPHPTIAYNHGPAATTYGHSHYAVNEGPTNYPAHSRYAIAAGPSLSYGHHAPRYPIPHAAGPVYNHGVRKIAYAPAIPHMGYQSHGSNSYSW